MKSAVLGQARAQKILAGFLAADRVPQSLLFLGPAGVGKSLAAKEFAAALLGLGEDAQNKNHPDLIVVNPAYQACLRDEEESKQKSLRIDTIREARRAMETSSMMGSRKVAILEDADTLEIEAANALLKILEEPPRGAVFILTASRRERLPKTVLSRCAAVAFAPLPDDVVREILTKHGIDEALAVSAARAADGSAGRALDLANNGYPQALLSGAAAPLRAADGLGADLATARTKAELALFALAQELRRNWREGRISFRDAARPLGEIKELGEALRANVDPRAIVLLACHQAQKVLA